MLYYYRISTLNFEEEGNYPVMRQGIVSAKNLGKAARRVVEEYTGASGEDNIEELTITPFSYPFASGDIATFEKILGVFPGHEEDC